MKTILKELLPAIITIAFILIFSASIWIIRSHFEARAYNRVTGATVTTWDAMWIELRVQGSDNP